MELEVADHPERERFEIHAEGELAGFVDYRLHEGEIELLHAETLSLFRHRGFAGRLVQFSLDSARQRQLAVLPYCPFVRRWIADHPEYADLVPEGRRPYFGLLPSRWGTGLCVAATLAPGAIWAASRHLRASAPRARIAVPMSFSARARFTGSNRHPADANAGG